MNGEQTKTNPNATSSITSSMQTSSSSLISQSSVPTARPTESSAVSELQHTNLALGIGLGIGLGIAVLLTGIGVLFCILKARRKRNKRSELQEPRLDQRPLEKFSYPIYEMQEEIRIANDACRGAPRQGGTPTPQKRHSTLEME